MSRKMVILFPLIFLLSSCANLFNSLDYEPGAMVETLSSPVSLSLHTPDKSMAGTGFLMYHRPDQLHMVMLSPFGTTLFESFIQGDRITLVYPSQSIAYTGRIDELPEKGGFQGWRLMRWVLDADPSNDMQQNGVVERLSKAGIKETVTFKDGLIISKAAPTGDMVYYSRYAVVNGAPLAFEIDMRNVKNDQVRLRIEEPEVNTPLDDSAFQPRFDGLTILPLSDIKGM